MTIAIELAFGGTGPSHWAPPIALANVLVWLFPLSVSTFLLFAELSNVGAARRAVGRELARVRAEREAFDAFIDRVEAIDPVSPSEVVAGPAAIRQATPDTARKVRSAYEDTVMATDHYEDDYGEPVIESMRAEFSPDVAEAVANGVTMTPPLREALLTQAEECRRERAAFADLLEAEADDLSRAESTLSAVVDRCSDVVDDAPAFKRSYGALRERRSALLEERERVEELVEDRQERIQGGYLPVPDSDAEFHEYLYADLEVRHPVLADAADLLSAIRDARRDLEWSMVRRA